MEIFQSTSTFEIFQGTSRFEKSVQILDVGLYRDYKALVHWIGEPKAEKKHPDFEIPVKSDVEYLNYYLKAPQAAAITSEARTRIANDLPIFVIVSLTWLAYFLPHDYLSHINSLGFLIYFLFLSDEGPTLETLDYTIRIGSTPTFLYFDLYLYSAYAAHYVYEQE